MSVSLLNRIKLKSHLSCRNFTKQVNQEWTDIPKYPEILDPSKKSEEKRQKAHKHKKLEALKTVEEKLFGINLERYYGWKCLILKEGNYPFNFLPFVKHITRTHLQVLSKEQFYKAQDVSEEECKEIVERLRPSLQEALLFELKGKKRVGSDIGLDKLSEGQREGQLARGVVEQLNSVLLTCLSNSYPHLLEAMIDYDPRVEAFWSVGGFHPSEEEYNRRKEKNENISEEEKAELVDHWMQYLGGPSLQLRQQYPLSVLQTKEVEGFRDADPPPPPVPSVNYDPQLAYGLQATRRHGTNIPGFWPGDKNEFGLLSFHHCGHLLDRPPHFGEKEHLDTTHAQAILASFGWLHAQACYQGFSTFSELTYPLTTQTVVTNGRLFSVYLYQLNTSLLHSDLTQTNPRSNLCLSLPPAPLYQSIEGNQFIGWNDEALAGLVGCYVNLPRERVGEEMKPYLGGQERYLADIAEEERREWLHNQFRHMYSNRPRHRLPYEIYDWERIYKIKFETRGMEARNRPFERDEDPLEERKYWEHSHAYIPRAQRTRRKHWTGWRAKFAKTYYPDV